MSWRFTNTQKEGKMQYNKEQCLAMVRSFNKKTFDEKLIILRDHKNVLELESDNGWTNIKFRDVPEEIQEEVQEVDWFEWEGEAFVHSRNLESLMSLAGIYGK